MIYVKPDVSDIEELERLWKSESNALGRTYPGSMKDFVEGGRCLCVKDNDRIVAFCTWDIMKRFPIVEIQLLDVVTEYRGLGLSKDLLYGVYDINRDFIEKLYYEYVADAVDGLPNNTFYDRISTDMEIRQKKVTKYRRYYLDIEMVSQWGPSKFGKVDE